MRWQTLYRGFLIPASDMAFAIHGFVAIQQLTARLGPYACRTSPARSASSGTLREDAQIGEECRRSADTRVAACRSAEESVDDGSADNYSAAA